MLDDVSNSWPVFELVVDVERDGGESCRRKSEHEGGDVLHGDGTGVAVWWVTIG